MSQPRERDAGLSGQCHCGAVRITLSTRPEFINECNCSLCNSHGVWWGYFVRLNVVVTGQTTAYGRADRDEPPMHLHFCPTCGCTTHWALSPQFTKNTGINDRMGVNMRLFDRAGLAGIELRYPDGQNWNGTGKWAFVREDVILC